MNYKARSYNSCILLENGLNEWDAKGFYPVKFLQNHDTTIVVFEEWNEQAKEALNIKCEEE